MEKERQPRVEMFGSVLCPYCHQARRFLKKHHIAYRYREVLMVFGYKPPLAAFREMKQRSGGLKTVPQLFLDGSHYGDEDRLIADERAGKIETIFR